MNIFIKIFRIYQNKGLIKFIYFIKLKIYLKFLSFGELENKEAINFSKKIINLKNKSIIFRVNFDLLKNVVLKEVDFPSMKLFSYDPYNKKFIPNRHHLKINWRTDNNSGKQIGDFMFANEYNKFNWLINNIFSYSISLERNILNQTSAHIQKWRNTFPVGYCVPYMTTLNVAQRLINILVGYELLIQLKKNQEIEKLLEILKSEASKEYFFLKNKNTLNNNLINNYIFCESSACLLFLSSFKLAQHSNKEEEKYWLKGLKRGLKEHINSNGFTREGSMAYSLFIFDCLILIKKIGYKTADEKLKIISKSLYYLTNDNCDVPGYGDISTERLFNYNDENILSAKTIIYTLSKIYNLNFNKGKNFKSITNFIINNEIIHKNSNLKKIELIEDKFYKNDYSIFSCKWGKIIFDISDIGLNKTGGHGHCDVGNFTLYDDQGDIIVDPGSYLYSANPKIRNKYRSSKMHNVFSYKDFEICDFKSLFEIENHPVTKIKKLKNELSIIIEINNNFLKKVKIKRSIKILPNGFEIIDTWNPKLPGSQRIFFHPNIKIIKRENKILLKNKSSEWEIKYTASDTKVNILQYGYSRSYGKIEPSKNLVFNSKTNSNKIIFRKLK